MKQKKTGGAFKLNFKDTEIGANIQEDQVSKWKFEFFSFKFRPDMAQPYIDLIADDIVKRHLILENVFC